jgi:uncharacterized protein (UPF0254 family)
MSTKKKIAIALGLATTAGLGKFGYDVNQEMKKWLWRFCIKTNTTR